MKEPGGFRVGATSDWPEWGAFFSWGARAGHPLQSQPCCAGERAPRCSGGRCTCERAGPKRLRAAHASSLRRGSHSALCAGVPGPAAAGQGHPAPAEGQPVPQGPVPGGALRTHAGEDFADAQGRPLLGTPAHARALQFLCMRRPAARHLTVGNALQAWDAGTCPLRLAGVQDADAVRAPPALLGPPRTVAALTGHFGGTCFTSRLRLVGL